MSKPTKILTIIILLTTLTAWGQSDRKVDQDDSIEVKSKIETFYSWYGVLIKSNKVHQDFSPNFIQRSDGMTALDFTKYRDGLKKHDFTDSFIERKINDYRQCVDNLGEIKYETFLKFEELDQFEEIKCAFNNVYEWTSDMEPHEGAELTSVKAINKKTITGIVKFFNVNVNGQKIFWDYKQAIVTFLRQGKGWKINDLKVELL
jgi:hypothetical protein